MHTSMRCTAAALAGCLWDTMCINNTHGPAKKRGIYSANCAYRSWRASKAAYAAVISTPRWRWS